MGLNLTHLEDIVKVKDSTIELVKSENAVCPGQKVSNRDCLRGCQDIGTCGTDSS